MTQYRLGDVVPRTPGPGRYWIAPDAAVIGAVILGDEASVWFGAVLRGDNDPITLGARTNVQDHAVLHTDLGCPLTLGDEVTVGHHAKLHGCRVGDGSLIGIGATVLNNARIGRGCVIGANALVTEGKEIPDYSLVVGAPGKVVKTLDEQTVEMVRAGALHYVKNWKRFAAELQPLDEGA